MNGAVNCGGKGRKQIKGGSERGVRSEEEGYCNQNSYIKKHFLGKKNNKT